ncbi:MAG: ATPase, T2SS/T4P/T4SS family [Phycisphaerales bacterium]
MLIDTLSSWLGADTAFLVSPFKPFLMALPFIPWAWLISSKLDKDAMYWHLPRTMWNSIHLAAGGLAVIALLTIPIFWIGWPVAMIILLAPILAYWKVRNDEVPEEKKFYLTAETFSVRMEKRRADAATRGALIRYTDSGGKARDVPQREDPLYATHLLSEDLIGPAIDSRSSRLELLPGPNGYVVAQTIDGVRFRRDPIAMDAGNLAIDYLKEVSGLDVQDRRRRQSGMFKLSGPSGDHKVNLTTAGYSKGQEVRIEFDRGDRLDKPYDGLGLLKQQMEALEPFKKAENREGIILLGAPAGHGLSTMGYAFLGRHDAYTTNIKTLEREIVVRKDGIDHAEFDSDNPDLDFSTNLQSILRRDPNIVMVGDIMDKGTAAIAAAHAVDGPLIYVLQRQPGVKEQLVDWVKRVGDLDTAVKPLRAVVNGRVFRTLCPNCRQPYQPSTEQLKQLNLPADKVKQLFKASGKVQIKNKIESCPICQGVGYIGQVGAFEVMVLDNTARKMIAQNDLQGAYMHCRRNKMIYLQEAALQKVIEGQTSLEEVVRVLSPPQKKAAAPAPKPQPA